METKYTQCIKVLSSRVGVDLNLDLISALNILQDNMCEYFKNIGCDGVTMVPKVGCFFALTKTKIKIHSTPSWLDKITLTTDITKLTNVRLNIESDIIKDGNICISCMQEMCAMDINSRKLRMIETTLLPKNIEVERSKFNDGFTRFDCEFDEKDFIEEYKIKPSNIDMYRHTNNVQYAKILLDTFELFELEKIDITEFEIHYLKESKVGDMLKIYRKQLHNQYVFEIKFNDEVITKAVLKYN